MSRAEMDALGWDSCDVILITGDAYIDHPSFGMALVGNDLYVANTDAVMRFPYKEGATESRRRARKWPTFRLGRW